MRRFSFVSLLMMGLALTAVACDSDTDPSDANTITFTSALSPANEVPPVAAPNADATASGNVTVILRVTRDSGGNVTAATADFATSVTGFPANTTITGAHIHPGAAGVNGTIAVQTNVAAGDVPLTGGAANFQRLNINVAADIAQNLINNPASFYYNVHTQLNGTGAIRGQLVRQ